MHLIKSRTALAGLTLIGGAVVGLGFASPATAAPAPAMASIGRVAPSCTGCEGAQFTGNGVRIHSCASTSCTTLGLGYKSNTVRVYCTNTPYKNGFVHIDDLTTGVSGWSAQQYVLWGCD